jgi:hypothetical protein
MRHTNPVKPVFDQIPCRSTFTRVLAIPRMCYKEGIPSPNCSLQLVFAPYQLEGVFETPVRFVLKQSFGSYYIFFTQDCDL